MTAIKDFRRDCYRGLTSFAKFSHPIADGNEAAVTDKFARQPKSSREAAAFI
jgi:hypothetical protein